MIKFNWYKSGDLFGVRYEFEKGDSLPRHTHKHGGELEHNVIVLEGTILLDKEDGALELAAGEVCDFNNEKQHTVTCLSDRAVTLHLCLQGFPPEYAGLPTSEHSGVVETQFLYSQ